MTEDEIRGFGCKIFMIGMAVGGLVVAAVFVAYVLGRG